MICILNIKNRIHELIKKKYDLYNDLSLKKNKNKCKVFTLLKFNEWIVNKIDLIKFWPNLPFYCKFEHFKLVIQF